MLAACAAALTAAGSGAAATATYKRTAGGPGHAQMYPSGLDVDAQGTVYVADTGNDQVEAYTATGTHLWTTGDRGPKALGRFSNPRDVAYLDGKLYVADTGYNRVQVLSARTGEPVTAWPTRFSSIIGISAGVDGRGNPVILAALDDRNTVEVFTPGGALIRAIGSGPGAGAGELNAPRDAATDPSGNVYVADYANNRIAKFRPGGGWIRSWGTRGTANGEFIRPYGVDLDASNRVYVADSANDRIQKFTKSGGFLAKYGMSGTGPGQFLQLRRVAVGPGRFPKVYGADLWVWKIARFTNGGAFDGIFGGRGPGDGLFNEPSGVAVSAGDVFVADAVNQRMQRFDAATGAFETTWGQRGWGNGVRDGFNWPRDIAVSPVTKTVWVADTKNNRVVEFGRDGTPTGAKMGVVGAGQGQMHWPYGLAVAKSGAVIVADTLNNSVVRWDPDTREMVWRQGTAAGEAMVNPYDVDVAGGVVYVADKGNRRVALLDAKTGRSLGEFGAGTLHEPTGIAHEADGEVWVTDTSFNRIVQFSPRGNVVQSLGATGSAHGRFNRPMHIDVESGRLYVADLWNDRVEVFDVRDG